RHALYLLPEDRHPFCAVLSLFFFSSRRRHTISKRDWSSDVCSSDLPPGAIQRFTGRRTRRLVAMDLVELSVVTPDPLDPGQLERSEERRVGKGRRYWRKREQCK